MEPITTGLIAWGPPGVLLAAALWAIGRLFSLYSEVQEKRIEEAGKYQAAMMDFTNTIKAYHEALRKGGP